MRYPIMMVDVPNLAPFLNFGRDNARMLSPDPLLHEFAAAKSTSGRETLAERESYISDLAPFEALLGVLCNRRTFIHTSEPIRLLHFQSQWNCLLQIHNSRQGRLRRRWQEVIMKTPTTALSLPP